MAKLRRVAGRVRRGDYQRALGSRLTRVLPEPSDGTVRVLADGRITYAHAADTADVHELSAQSLSGLLASLEGISAIVSAPTPRRPHRLAIRDDDAGHLQGALEAMDRSWAILARSEVAYYLRRHCARDGRFIEAGSMLDVQIDILRRDGDYYKSDKSGAITRVEANRWHSIAKRSLSSLDSLPAPTFDSSIDAVYTWVDGDDQLWQTRRDMALRDFGNKPLHITSVDPARYANSDELRYSLRSLYQYANWIRKIFIVTDRQVPSWLKTSNERVRIVDHSEILGGSRFNSHAIEAALHRIPGLSENYLYLNDDVFFGRTAYPTDYFASSLLAKFFPSDLPIDPGPASEDDLPIMAAAKNGREIMKARFGKNVQTKIRHTVHPQLRSVCEQIEMEFPGELAQTRANLFRTFTDVSVPASLQHWYSWALGTAVASPIDYLYLDIGTSESYQVLDALLSLRRYDTFCLNQEHTTGSTSTGHKELQRFLERYYPHRAPWELE